MFLQKYSIEIHFSIAIFKLKKIKHIFCKGRVSLVRPKMNTKTQHRAQIKTKTNFQMCLIGKPQSCKHVMCFVYCTQCHCK